MLLRPLAAVAGVAMLGMAGLALWPVQQQTQTALRVASNDVNAIVRLASRQRHDPAVVLPVPEETIDPFVASLTPDSPLGFATLDVDYYSSSTHALRLFLGDARCYLPTVPVYVDDVHERTHTRFAGELLAIGEFNEENALRKLDVDRSLSYSRVFKHAEWLQHMYLLHVFDHPERSDVATAREVEVAPNPYLD